MENEDIDAFLAEHYEDVEEGHKQLWHLKSQMDRSCVELYMHHGYPIEVLALAMGLCIADLEAIREEFLSLAGIDDV